MPNKTLNVSTYKSKILPRLEDIDEREIVIVCHCSIVKYPQLKHPQLHYIQNGVMGDKIGDNIKYIDPLCPDDNWDNITNNSLMYIWGIFCPIYTSYYDAKIITTLLSNSYEKLKLNGRVLFPALEDKNIAYFTNNPFPGFTFSRIHITQLSFIIDKKIPTYTEYYVFTKEQKNTCARILTPKQVGPICWFMATFVAMFYSQRSRKLLLDASPGWNKKKELFTLLKQVLNDKYLKTASRESKDYEKFSDDTFGKILRLLYKENSNAFPYDPDTIDDGFIPELYIGKLYNLLNIDYKMFSYNVNDDILLYSDLNEEFKRVYKIVDTIPQLIQQHNKAYNYVEENIEPPQVLMVLLRRDFVGFHYRDLFPNTVIKDGDTKKNIKSLREKIYYLGVEYNLDSVVLENWNEKGIGFHAIAGITCKMNKYVYNGWTRTSMDPAMANKIITREIPCELMPYNWNIKKNGDFCLNTKQCIPDIYKTKFEAMKSDLCFNFSKGKRILVYIRKDPMRETSIETDDTTHKKAKATKAVKVPKKCPDGKVLNPATGRCILSKNAAKTVKDVKKSKQPNTLHKKCPDGKVLNPATGRCILSKNAVKAGIAMKATNLPNKPKQQKQSPKKCPDGKVLNPATGRCILSKNLKNKKYTD
jgi:hypothetical protein